MCLAACIYIPGALRWPEEDTLSSGTGIMEASRCHSINLGPLLEHPVLQHWSGHLDFFFFFLNGVYSLLYLMDEGLDSSGEEG